MDRDGSNQKMIFPAGDLPGLEPQQVVWSPVAFPDGTYRIAVTYQGNLWIVNPSTGQADQITGDGLIKIIDW